MRLFNNLQLSLTTKLIVVSVVVEAVLLAYLIWNDTNLTQTRLLTQKQQEISELATFISATIAPALSRNDMQELFNAVKHIGKSPTIGFAAIKTLNDQTIAQTGVSQQAKPVNQNLLNYIKFIGRADTYQIVTPLKVDQTVLGQLYLEFKIDDVENVLADTRKRGIKNAFAIIVVTAIVLYVLLSALTKNLKNLTAAMTEYIDNKNITTPIPHSNDEVGKLSTTFENLMTAIRDSEESLKESQDFLQTILDHSPAVIYAKDKDGKYLLANQQLKRLLPKAVDNILGKTDFDLFPPEVASRLHENDKKVLDNKTIQLLEAVVPLEGEFKNYISTKFCLFDKNHQAYAVCGISTDITERIKNEKKIKDSEENLRSLANNATDGILVNKKGKHVFTNQRMAEILNTTVDDIIGSTQDFVLHPSEKDNVVQRFKRRLIGQNEPIQYETKRCSWIKKPVSRFQWS
ncbi:MAG: hypothetical protein AMJ53_01430 [Gammaproteobacteria bacterium SG8_11]|nr:MAG: hypothetical protein AMJ53_01430 [Gammaproteobacteria bacterium SG8_11]